MDLMIRHAEESDSRGLMQLHSLPSVVAGTLQLPFQPESLWLKRIKEKPDSSYILLAEMDSDIVGSFGLLVASHCPRRKHSATIGMAVKDCQRNKGIGSRLLQAGLELSDNWLNVTRVELMVFTDNDAAIHLYQKFGFDIEGRLKKYAYKNGDYCDVYSIARIKS